MKLRRLLPLLLLTACDGDPVAPLRPAEVQMTVWLDQSAVSPGPNVHVRLENLGRRTVYVTDHCGDAMVPRLERREGEQWVPEPVDLGGCLMVATPPIEVEPGETVSRSFPLHAAGHYRSTVRVTPGGVERIVAVRHEFTIDP